MHLNLLNYATYFDRVFTINESISFSVYMSNIYNCILGECSPILNVYIKLLSVILFKKV